MAPIPELPIAISSINGRHLIFSIDAVSYLRREHRICGVLLGSIPQIPQQNVFFGLPLELMPEEVRLLVLKGVAYIVDDAHAHEGVVEVRQDKRQQYLNGLNKEGMAASKRQAGKKEQQRQQALKKLGSTPRSSEVDDSVDENVGDGHDSTTASPSTEAREEPLFAPADEPRGSQVKSANAIAFGVTPATSHALLPTPPPIPDSEVPEVHRSYPLYSHLHEKGYFLSPGLRFGCQYLVYPGDPLRFHSHFLAVGAEWDEEIDLMDIVGGGRLGTGVKKGYLIGGAQTQHQETEDAEIVKTFSVEWAGM